MDVEIYKRAKYLREGIDSIEGKMASVQRMKQRTGDEEFNNCRQLAYDNLSALKEILEKEFKAL